MPADISFATMTTMDRASPAAELDNFVAPDPVDTRAIYYGDGLAGGGTGSEGTSETTAQGRSAVELFDDIFGSSPDDNHHHRQHQRGHRSPSGGAATASSPTIPPNNEMRHDDHRHPSDMNRLQQEHSTAGYREGLNEGKNSTLQAGFDEGYSLGAAIGGVVGELLGMLEALVVSGGEEEEVPSTTAGASAENGDTLTVLLGRARRDLTAPSIFSPGYFAPDGTWTYDVEASETAATIQANSAQAVEAADAAVHATIFDVANAHPLVKIWRGIVDRQLERRRIRWGKEGDDAALAKALGLKDEDENEGQSEKPAAADAAVPAATARAPANNASALDW